MNYTINNLDQVKPILVGFRKSNNLSQKELAQKLGVSQQSYQAMESNPQKATLERLFKVFALLGVRVVLADDIALSSQTNNETHKEDQW